PGFGQPTDPPDPALQQPTMHAFDPAMHTVPWEQNGPPGVGASSVASGVVFAGAVAPGSLRAFDTQTGLLLSTIPTGGSVDSSPALVGAALYFAPGASEGR